MMDEARLWFMAKVAGWCALGCIVMATYGCAHLVGLTS